MATVAAARSLSVLNINRMVPVEEQGANPAPQRAKRSERPTLVDTQPDALGTAGAGTTADIHKTAPGVF